MKPVARLPAHGKRALFHAGEAAPPHENVSYRGAGCMVSLDAERRAFALAARLADLACTTAQHAAADERCKQLLLRHPEASRFLLMNDFVGLLRPLVDILALAGQADAAHLPLGEWLAKGALWDISNMSLAPRQHVLQHKRRWQRPVERLVHLVDTASPFEIPASITPDIVLEPRRSKTTPKSVFKLVHAFNLLRQSGVEHHLALLLSHSFHRFMSQRLAMFASFETDVTDLCPEPVVYWSNMSAGSVFHASERRARGLPTIAAHTILMDPSDRYFCDVFDAVITCGTGQGASLGLAFRNDVNMVPTPASPAAGRVVIAMQPSADIMQSLAIFAKQAVAAGFNVAARPHPVHRRNRSLLSFWQHRMGVALDEADEMSFDAVALVATGTSNFAIHACCHGTPVALLCGVDDERRLWPDSPTPGFVVPPALRHSNQETDFNTVLAESRMATTRYQRFHAGLPRLQDIAAGFAE